MAGVQRIPSIGGAQSAPPPPPWSLYTVKYRPGVGHYQGAERGSLRHGDGLQTWECSRHMGTEYAGEWKDDTAHGKGRLSLLPDALVCEGGWRSGRLHGWGCRVTLPDHSVFTGVFRDGLPDGPDCEWLKKSGNVRFKGSYARGKALKGKVEDKASIDDEKEWRASGTDASWDWPTLLSVEILATEKQVEETLTCDTWINERTEDLRGLWDKRQDIVMEFVKRYEFETENKEPVTTNSLRALAIKIFEKMPSGYLFSQTRILANIEAKRRASVRSKNKDADEDFMALVMEADEQCPLAGKNAFHWQKKISTLKSLAEGQHPNYHRELLMGRVEEVDADTVTNADLHLDLTKPPCNPGDMEYVAKLPCADTSKMMKTYNGERFPRKYVDRYCGHVLRSIKSRVDASVENLLGDDSEEISEKLIRHRMHGDAEGKGCQRSVSGGATHDLSDICTHVPAYSMKGDFDPILLAGQRLNQVDYKLGPKPEPKEGEEDLPIENFPQRSFKLNYTPRPGEIDSGSGSFRVSPGRSQAESKRLTSPRQLRSASPREKKNSPNIGIFHAEGATTPPKTPLSRPGTSSSLKRPQWDSEGMLLPGYQRKKGMIPEVRTPFLFCFRFSSRILNFSVFVCVLGLHSCRYIRLPAF
jgi:hypothetical protein